MEIVDWILNNIVMFLLIITLLVFVHEMGHFLIARRCGVRVEVFSIGFGPELYGWTGRKSGTRWRISALPLGGYVKFFGDANAASGPADQSTLSADERRFSFHAKSVWQRMAIVAGGPLANLLFALVALMVLFMIVGRSFTPPVIGVVAPDGAAAAAGLQPGDRIVAADGRGIDSFEDILQIAQINPGTSIPVTVERGGRRLDATVKPAVRDYVDRFGNAHRLGELGISSLNALPVIGSVETGTPAEGAGLRPGDRILSVDGEEVASFLALRDIIVASPEKPLALLVERQGSTVSLQATPRRVTAAAPDGTTREIGQLGFKNAVVSEHQRLGPVSALGHAGKQLVFMTETIFTVIKQIVLGLRPANEIGGPLRIAKVSGEASQIGWEAVVMLVIGLSVTLGVFNLLPVPMLDGGHLVFYLFEAVRGRPLSLRTQEYALRFGLFLVLCLVVFATWNDLVLLKVTELVGKLGQ
ncbi:MAG: RIP metalloprotease RseP [Reyranellaceae bacterium]